MNYSYQANTLLNIGQALKTINSETILFILTKNFWYQNQNQRRNQKIYVVNIKMNVQPYDASMA